MNPLEQWLYMNSRRRRRAEWRHYQMRLEAELCLRMARASRRPDTGIDIELGDREISELERRTMEDTMELLRNASPRFRKSPMWGESGQTELSQGFAARVQAMLPDSLMIDAKTYVDSQELTRPCIFATGTLEEWQRSSRSRLNHALRLFDAARGDVTKLQPVAWRRTWRHLSPRRREFAELHFKGMTMAEAAKSMGITRVHVGQLRHGCAIMYLRMLRLEVLPEDQ